MRLQYILMNRDSEWLHFSCQQDEFGENFCREQEWNGSLRPHGYYELTDWLRGRQAPKHRKHIQQLLERYGCRELEGFLQVSHALSLNDTFWVKEEGSSLSWNQVSLYRNDFDELVSQAAFDGRISSTTLSTTSPEFGTDGGYAKCWVREGEQILLYKSGSSTFEIEPLSEYLACQVARQLGCEHVEYDLAFYHGRLISSCPLFTNEDTGLVKAHDVLGRGERSISAMLQYFASIGAEDAFRRMCVLDALILNIDRHLGNFGVLADNRTMEVLGMAPIYDNNRSLLFDMDVDQLKNLEWCIRTCSPRIGADFISTARGMLTDDMRQKLAELKEFEFSQHPKIQAEQERLDALSAMVRLQAKRILE